MGIPSPSLPPPPPFPPPIFYGKKPWELGRSFFINALEKASLQTAALDRSILRDCTGIMSSIFFVRKNSGQGFAYCYVRNCLLLKASITH